MIRTTSRCIDAMNTGARIGQEISKLWPEELAEFRAGFSTFDAKRRDL